MGGRLRNSSAGDKRRVAVLMLLVAAFCWGSGNVANKTVLLHLDPNTAVAARNLVAAVVLLPFAFRELAAVSSVLAWARSSLLPSGLFAVANILQQWAYQTATVTNASFLVNTSSVLTPIIAFLVVQERPKPRIGLAAALTLLGAYLISGAGRSLAVMNVGDSACLVSAVFYACWMVALSRHSVRHGCALSTTCVHALLTAGIGMLLVALLGPAPPANWTRAIPEVLYLGIVSTALAFGLTAAAQAHVSASTAAVLVAAESIFGAAGAVLILGEQPGFFSIIGAAVMLVAIALVACAPAAPAEHFAQKTLNEGSIQ